jgi:hypothetical protein
MATQYTAGLTTGQVLTAATMNSIGAAWESYTPTLTQPGAITKTVTYAKFTQINKLCICNIRLDVTGTGTTSNQVIVGLPLTSATSASMSIGSASFYDASTATMYAANVRLASTTTVVLCGDWSGQFELGRQPAIPLGNGDQITFSVMYEIA